jgi:hypothetical protein
MPRAALSTPDIIFLTTKIVNGHQDLFRRKMTG